MNNENDNDKKIENKSLEDFLNNVTPVDNVTHISEAEARKKYAAERSAIVLGAKKKLRALTKEKEWDLSQRLMHEVFAGRIIQDPTRKVPVSPTILDDYLALVEERYGNPGNDADKELYELLKAVKPNMLTLRRWSNLPNWESAVWACVKNTGMFTPQRRTAMIDALFRRGVEKDTQAAKIWLTLSGDLVEKTEVVNDPAVEKFREINEILHKNKTNG